MAYTKAGQKAVDKYVKNNYDNLTVRVPKGNKAELQAHAEKMGESLNAFVNRSMSETVERDTNCESRG